MSSSDHRDVVVEGSTLSHHCRERGKCYLLFGPAVLRDLIDMIVTPRHQFKIWVCRQVPNVRRLFLWRGEALPFVREFLSDLPQAGGHIDRKTN